jgi:ethanolamine utilization protein EutA
MKVATPIVSIDGLELKDFDYIDIGAILDTSGAVAVVIKSLVFPTGVGREWAATPIAAGADGAS